MIRQWRAVHLALTFLTTLPLPAVTYQEGDFARASQFYPLAGYVVGGGVALWLWLPLPLPLDVRAALAVGLWLLLTGMLHFDGLVDSADALLSMKSPAKRLDILKDVHVGAFGLAVGGTYLLVLWSLLKSGLPPLAPLVAAVSARTLLLLPVNLYPAARAASLGASSRRGLVALPVALALAAPTFFVAGALWAWLLGLLAALGLARWAAGRLGGGLTGDIYGLLIIAAEIAALCALAGEPLH